MGFVKETISRLSADTPQYFKKVRAFGYSLAAAGGSMLGVPAAVKAISDKVHIPDAVTTYGGHMLVYGTIVSIVAGLACQNPAEIKK